MPSLGLPFGLMTQAFGGMTGDPYENPFLGGGQGGGGLTFPVMPGEEMKQAMAHFGVQFPEQLQQNMLFPNQSRMMQMHPGIARGLEGAALGMAMTPPAPLVSGAGSGMTRAMQGLLGVPQARRQFQIAQIMAPLQMAQHGAGLQAAVQEQKLRETLIPELEAITKYYGQTGEARAQTAQAAVSKAQAAGLAQEQKIGQLVTDPASGQLMRVFVDKNGNVQHEAVGIEGQKLGTKEDPFLEKWNFYQKLPAEDKGQFLDFVRAMTGAQHPGQISPQDRAAITSHYRTIEDRRKGYDAELKKLAPPAPQYSVKDLNKPAVVAQYAADHAGTNPDGSRKVMTMAQAKKAMQAEIAQYNSSIEEYNRAKDAYRQSDEYGNATMGPSEWLGRRKGMMGLVPAPSHQAAQTPNDQAEQYLNSF